MARHWSRPLARKVRLADGQELATLRDAGTFCTERFAAVTHSEPIAHACALLMRAAESGKAADVRAGAVRA